MTTPSHHRVHHARNPKYLDKNYGHIFIFWDKLFGTFMEEEEEPEPEEEEPSFEDDEEEDKQSEVSDSEKRTKKKRKVKR